jgi:hypothetical protein
MKSERFIYSKTPSRCCGERALLVRSRAGGFVSRNCLKCGKSDYVTKFDLPDMLCDHCGQQLEICTTDSAGGRNYSYNCSKCDHRWVLADVIPHWAELFTYSGLAAAGDFQEA